MKDKTRLADDAELYRDTELWTGISVSEETEAQKEERLELENREIRRERRRLKKKWLTKLAKKVFWIVLGAVVTTVVRQLIQRLNLF